MSGIDNKGNLFPILHPQEPSLKHKQSPFKLRFFPQRVHILNLIIQLNHFIVPLGESKIRNSFNPQQWLNLFPFKHLIRRITFPKYTRKSTLLIQSTRVSFKDGLELLMEKKEKLVLEMQILDIFGNGYDLYIFLVSLKKICRYRSCEDYLLLLILLSIYFHFVLE